MSRRTQIGEQVEAEQTCSIPIFSSFALPPLLVGGLHAPLILVHQEIPFPPYAENGFWCMLRSGCKSSYMRCIVRLSYFFVPRDHAYKVCL